MVSTLCSPRLHPITFIVSGTGFRVLEEQWGALDVLLATTRFTLVQVELITLFSDATLQDGMSQEDLEKARQTFPRCDEHKRLLATRAPFTVYMRTHYGFDEDPRDFHDHDGINWVCGIDIQYNH
ncbi:hypothetical protein PM082_009537 [Marasmius tenuissimus]|nr:hypothetical protein PM082_009537 [Marasmius tenuissimus]